MRRGDIRTALLVALADGPGHGYEIIGRLEEKSGGVWRPSPGSVYPTLQMFEDEGLVRSEVRDGQRVYELTDAGRAEAPARAEKFGNSPWEDLSAGLQEGIRGVLKAGEKLGRSSSRSSWQCVRSLCTRIRPSWSARATC
jgi:DNA-binding PadR family transcriptional regulator